MMKAFFYTIILIFGFSSCSKTDRRIENLKTFAKAYGYIKYFHPSDEAYELDWDKFAIYGAEKALGCKSEKELVETLDSLFKPIAPTVEFSNSDITKDFIISGIRPKNLKGYSEYFWHHQGVGFGMENSYGVYQSTRIEVDKKNDTISYRPKFGEVISDKIGDNIYFSLPIVLYKNREGTYPKADTGLLEQLQALLENLQVDSTELSFRLGNIIIVYNVFQHFYPYFDVVDVNWEHEFEKAIEQSFVDKVSKDHINTLEKFTASLKDGHISVESKDTPIKNFYPPFSWEWIENKLIVTKIWNDSSPIKIGDEITEVDNQSARDYFDNIENRISAGTKGWLKHKSEQLGIRGEKNSKITLKVNDKNIVFTRNMDPYSEPKKYDRYNSLGNGIHYLNLTLLDMEAINYLLPKLEDSKSIICDLRGRPNLNHEFITHLLKTPDTTNAWMRIPKIVYPNREKIAVYQNGSWKNEMKPKKPYLGDKKIVFITDGEAISYAESYMGYIEGYNLATIIGQPTAGTNGNVNKFTLPGNITISFTGMKVLKHDGSQLHGVGILPDIFVEKTIKGIKEGRDEFLEKAMAIATKE